MTRIVKEKDWDEKKKKKKERKEGVKDNIVCERMWSETRNRIK